ncbi:MAG: 4-hydroxythreonine-4-phosphate dehydrogenase PdxA [Pseudomonadota bacterium]
MTDTGGSAPLVLTMGDPAGIGAEITLGAWASGRVRRPFVLIDDPDRIAALAGPTPVVHVSSLRAGAEAFAAGLPVIAPDTALAVPPVLGRPDAANADATVAAIEQAVGLALDGAASAVVTNPISKKVLYDGCGFAHPGHTEFLAALGGGGRSVMMLAGPSLRVVPVTIHIPLAAVPQALSEALILETARITAEGLRRDFGLAEPRIAVAGLNPHAGEGGAMGHEEMEVIAPAIARLKAEGYAVSGPHPADTMFHPPARGRYDVALTMYHDQGLIPIKALDFDDGVNVTLGLPFLRTSPDHGTAFDIAGQGVARPDSLIAALNLAGDLAEQRRATGALAAVP